MAIEDAKKQVSSFSCLWIHPNLHRLWKGNSKNAENIFSAYDQTHSNHHVQWNTNNVLVLFVSTVEELNLVYNREKHKIELLFVYENVSVKL